MHKKGHRTTGHSVEHRNRLQKEPTPCRPMPLLVQLCVSCCFRLCRFLVYFPVYICCTYLSAQHQACHHPIGALDKKAGHLRSVLISSKPDISKRGSQTPELLLVLTSKGPCKLRSLKVWPIFLDRNSIDLLHVRIDGRMDGWTDGRMDGWTDARAHARVLLSIYLSPYL